MGWRDSELPFSIRPPFGHLLSALLTAFFASFRSRAALQLEILALRRARRSGDPFARVQDVSEQPNLVERGVSVYTMQPAYFESRLYGEKHREHYFDVPAANRINNFILIFGFVVRVPQRAWPVLKTPSAYRSFCGASH